jgi:16S rRNA (uracil1498-N3)-methyltransferase
MRLHRFYLPNTADAKDQNLGSKSLWVHESGLLAQWKKVLRYKEGQELVLFDDTRECLYRIIGISKNDSVHLEYVTEYERKIPQKEVYLFWSVLKKDKNDWVLQKATELGVMHFIPLLCDRTEKQNFNYERAMKIIIEASEQCGRSDIPKLREPISLAESFKEYESIEKFMLESDGTGPEILQPSTKLGLFIGPEGGWSEEEKKFFEKASMKKVSLGQFTLRAETAVITAVAAAFSA